MAASQITAPWMAASQMAASDLSYFANFEQVKNLIVILLTLSKLRKLTKKLSWEKLDAYASFFGHGFMLPTLRPGFSDL